MESAPGRGATFRVYLPRAEGAPAEPSDDDEAAPVQGTGAILLVEDEGSLRRLASRALSRLGYRVVEAADGLEALRLLQGAADREFRLVITDMVMPGMAGSSLVETVHASYPGTRVLVMSGYADGSSLQSGVLKADIPFLPKPFTLDQLAAAVRRSLSH